MPRFAFLVVILALVSLPASPQTHGANDPPRRAMSVDLGVQPLGYPTGLVGALMGRDRVLRRALAALGHDLDTFAFRGGPDIVERLDGQRLEAGLIGDMPTIAAIAKGDALVAGIVKRATSAIVSREEGLMTALRGRRIAYVEGSSAHSTLLEALASAGLGESDVELVPMSVDTMPAALLAGDISAFAAWEPAPAIALAQHLQHRIVFRGRSTDYLVLSRRFEAAHPEAARLLVASLVRAVRWLQRSRANIESAAFWAMADGARLTGHPAPVSARQAVRITREALLDVPAVPIIPASAHGMAGLGGKLMLLQRLGKVPRSIGSEQIDAAFAYDGLQQVLADPAKYRLNNFDYDR